MKRPGGVTVIAVFALLGSLACLGLGCITGLALLTAKNRVLDTASAPYAKVGMIFGFIFMFGPAVWGITSAIGLLRIKSWGKISTLIFAGLLIFFGLVSPLFLLFVPFPTAPNANAPAMAGIKIALSGFYLLLAAIGAWWMIYLTRPRVKAVFQSSSGPVTPSRRPVSISIIGWVLVTTTCFIPINIALHVPMMLFGLILGGWTANLCLVVLAAYGLFSGISLLQLKPYAPSLMYALIGFGSLNTLVTWLLPGSADRISRFMQQMPGYMRSQPQLAFNPLAMLVLTLPMMLVPLFFLIRHKALFVNTNALSSNVLTTE